LKESISDYSNYSYEYGSSVSTSSIRLVESNGCNMTLERRNYAVIGSSEYGVQSAHLSRYKINLALLSTRVRKVPSRPDGWDVRIKRDSDPRAIVVESESEPPKSEEEMTIWLAEGGGNATEGRDMGSRVVRALGHAIKLCRKVS